MAQNHPSDNIYNILNKLESLKPTLQEKHDATVQQIRESVEARGSITSGVSSVEKRLMERFAAESDFSKMSNAIQKTGKSKASADAITAAAGREKLGQKEMTRRAVAGKKKATHEGNVVSGAPANKSIPVGATIPGTNLKKNKQIEVEEAFNPNSVDAQQARDSKAHHHAELKKKADAGDADAQKRLGMIKKRRDADVKNFNDKMDYMEECAMCAEGTCTEHGLAEGDGDEAYVACIVQFNRSGRAMVQRTKPISHERAEEVIRNALAKNTFVHPPFMTIYPASAGKLDGSTIMAQFPDMSQKGLAEGSEQAAQDYSNWLVIARKEKMRFTGKTNGANALEIMAKYNGYDITDVIRNILAYVKQNRQELGREVSEETGQTVKDAIIDIRNKFPQEYQAAQQPQGVAEGDEAQSSQPVIPQDQIAKAWTQNKSKAQMFIKNVPVAIMPTSKLPPNSVDIVKQEAGKRDQTSYSPEKFAKGLAAMQAPKQGKGEVYIFDQSSMANYGPYSSQITPALSEYLQQLGIDSAIAKLYIKKVPTPFIPASVFGIEGKRIQTSWGDQAVDSGAFITQEANGHTYCCNPDSEGLPIGYIPAQQGVAEGFPTVADAKADHEKKEKEKGTGKFEKKTNPKSGGIEYTRKSSTYDNGDKKSVKESMDQIQTRFLMEASFKRIAEEHGETLEEMMAQMAKDMEHYHNTGHASHLLRDCMEIHWHNKQDVEETANRPELSDPWMGVKDAPPPASTAPTPPASTASFAHKVAGAAKNFGKKALNTLGGPDYEGSKDMLQKSMYDEELDELAELAGLTIGKRLPEASVKVDTPEVEPVNGPKEEYATMNQAPNVFGPGDPATIAGGSNGNYGGRGDNKMATRVNRPAPVVSTPSVKPVKTLESYIEAEYNSIKKQK